MQDLYEQLIPLEKELGVNDAAMRWFDFPAGIPSTPLPEFPSISLTGLSDLFCLTLCLMSPHRFLQYYHEQVTRLVILTL